MWRKGHSRRKTCGHVEDIESDNVFDDDAGTLHEGTDSAVLLRATWRDTRRAVLKAGGVTEFAFRQYLFACQARVLLRMRQPQEVRLSRIDPLEVSDHGVETSKSHARTPEFC